MYYIIKAKHIKTGKITYYLQGHSKLTENASVASKYYVWTKESASVSYMKRLMKSSDAMNYEWSVVTTEDENIEVR